MKKEIRYNDGTYYSGDVNEKGQPHGKGYIKFPNGAYYDGDFLNNTLTGMGIYHYKDGTVYVGQLKNAYRHGKGFFDWKDGATYEGTFVNDKIDGYGILKFIDGSKYTGCWENNFRTGEGVLEFTDGGSIAGNFSNNMYNGLMTRTWPNGTKLEAVWNNSVFCGHGKIYYDDGSVYEGALDENNNFDKCGFGIMTKPDGTIYEGYFHNNWFNDQFKVTFPDGHVEIHNYRDGELINVVSRKSADGRDLDALEQAKEVLKQRNVEVDEKLYLTVRKQEDSCYAEELRPYFRDLIGMDSVKQQLDRIYKRFRIDAMRQKLLSMEAQKQGYYFIVTGNPGTGKTTVARIIGMMLHDVGILPNNTFVEVDRSGLVGEYIGQTEKKTASVIDSARGGTLFIDEAYTLYRKDSANDFGKEAIDTLLKDMEDHRGEYCVIMAGYSHQMNDMIRNANPGLASRFDHKINIPDYTEEEILNILVSMALQKNFFIKKEARSVILQRISKEKVDDTFDNARFARRLLDEAIEKQALRLAENYDNVDLNELQVLQAEDFGKIETEASDLDMYLEKLNSLIGLKSVKKELNNIIASVRIQAESRKRGLAIAGDLLPVNMVFTGNPGTDKTTVARLMGKIYYYLGLLKRDDVFVECTRADLVGRYQGETALKVKEVIRKSLGGVLFIDEAYSLVNNENDSFGLEAVNTLVSEMENNRDKLAVILAGYTRDMQEFLDSNTGLRSRLSKVIEFEDYTVDEMVEIYKMDLKKRGYTLDVSDEKLHALIENRSQNRDFGNARGVRNLCDEAVARHNAALFDYDVSQLTNELITTITDKDL